NNTISGNTANPGGGGIYIFDYENALIVENLIINNTAVAGAYNNTVGWGGGIMFDAESPPGPYLINNTIANNGGVGGSGVYASGYPSQSELFNNLIIAKPGQPALVCASVGSTATPVVQYNDAFSSGGTGFGGNCWSMAGTNRNISADPLFLNGASN